MCWIVQFIIILGQKVFWSFEITKDIAGNEMTAMGACVLPIAILNYEKSPQVYAFRPYNGKLDRLWRKTKGSIVCHVLSMQTRNLCGLFFAGLSQSFPSFFWFSLFSFFPLLQFVLMSILFFSLQTHTLPTGMLYGQNTVTLVDADSFSETLTTLANSATPVTSPPSQLLNLFVAIKSINELPFFTSKHASQWQVASCFDVKNATYFIFYQYFQNPTS